MVATKPCGSFRASVSRPLAPYKVAKRERMFDSPTPLPSPCSAVERPAPVSATVTRNMPASDAATIRMLPPSRSGLSPCLIAFSTSESSIIGGKAAREQRRPESLIPNLSLRPIRISCVSR